MLTALGMTAVLRGLGGWFDGVRWIGVVYLLWLGVRQWRAAPATLPDAGGPKSARTIYARGIPGLAHEPQDVVLLRRVFPQFVRPGPGLGVEVAVLATSFLLIAVTVDSVWALAAGRARGLLVRHATVRNRISGGVLVAAAVALAAARRNEGAGGRRRLEAG